MKTYYKNLMLRNEVNIKFNVNSFVNFILNTNFGNL